MSRSSRLVTVLRQTAPLLGLALALTSSCASPGKPAARILDDDEGDLVGSSSAGAAVYKPQITAVVTEMLSDHSASNDVVKATMCVLNIDNQGAEDLGDWSAQLYEYLNSEINNSDRYRTVSKRFMDAGLREANLRPDELFIPRNQREFSSVLESMGNPIEILVFPRLTTGTTSSGATQQRDYILALEFVDISNGWDRTYRTDPIRKEYNR